MHRRLTAYQLSDRLFRENYGMTLEQFEAAEVARQHGYSFEVETDHQDWDQAVRWHAHHRAPVGCTARQRVTAERVISMIKATSYERIRHEQLLRNQLGAG